MADNEYKFTIPNRPGVQGTVIGVLRNTLIETLKAAALAHGNKPGQWLDDLENESLGFAKELVGENMSIEQEADAVGVAVRLISDVFDQFRTALDDFNS